MVAHVVEQHREEIAALCREHRIRALWVFGSAACGEWDPQTSDIDFLVDLGEYSNDYAHRFFTLRRSLAELMQKKVDLVSVGGLGDDDDWFRREIGATKVIVYDARRDQLVA